MAKMPFDDYRKELEFQRAVWERKEVLRLLYRHWYAQAVALFCPLRPVAEIGSGCGNFKEYYPACISTDIFPSGPWIDRVMDAGRLDFAAGSVGNLAAFDVLHHLQRPLDFLRQAAAVLQPGGRLILCEPAVTPWSRLVYGPHHEPIDTAWPLFELDGQPAQPDEGHKFANMASAEILFWKQAELTFQRVPGLRLALRRKFGFLLYPLTGGFSYRCFVPRPGFSALLCLEDALLRPFSALTGLRMFVVLEKES